MVYTSQDETLVCKVQPARESKHFQSGWDQNAIEAQVYKTLAGRLSGKEHPELQIVYHGVMDIFNTWGEPDRADCLVILRLGPDLQ